MIAEPPVGAFVNVIERVHFGQPENAKDYGAIVYRTARGWEYPGQEWDTPSTWQELTDIDTIRAASDPYAMRVLVEVRVELLAVPVAAVLAWIENDVDQASDAEIARLRALVAPASEEG